MGTQSLLTDFSLGFNKEGTDQRASPSFSLEGILLHTLPDDAWGSSFLSACCKMIRILQRVWRGWWHISHCLLLAASNRQTKPPDSPWKKLVHVSSTPIAVAASWQSSSLSTLATNQLWELTEIDIHDFLCTRQQSGGSIWEYTRFQWFFPLAQHRVSKQKHPASTFSQVGVRLHF